MRYIPISVFIFREGSRVTSRAASVFGVFYVCVCAGRRPLPGAITAAVGAEAWWWNQTTVWGRRISSLRDHGLLQERKKAQRVRRRSLGCMKAPSLETSLFLRCTRGGSGHIAGEWRGIGNSDPTCREVEIIGLYGLCEGRGSEGAKFVSQALSDLVEYGR